jgi:hypothetical protein
MADDGRLAEAGDRAFALTIDVTRAMVTGVTLPVNAGKLIT